MWDLREPVRSCLFLVGSLFLADRGQALTFVVDRLDDPNPPVLSCTAAPADCSLRGAILLANASAESDVIQLGAGIHLLSLPGADEEAGLTGDLDIQHSVRLRGLGSNVTQIRQANPGSDRILDLHPSVASFVWIEGIKLGHGGAEVGGAVRCGSGTLRADGVEIFGSTATERGGGLAVLENCQAYVSDFRFISNFAEDAGGGLYVTGYAVMRRGRIRANVTDGQGGGLFAEDATILLERVELSANSAAVGGGAFFFGHGGATDYARLENVTVAGNVAPSGPGLRSQSALLYVESSTITGHAVGILAIELIYSALVNLSGSILDDPCLIIEPAEAGSNGGNVETNGDTCHLFQPSDQTGVTPVQLALDALGDNGGGSWTSAIGSGSVARNSVPEADCPMTDQRGALRAGVNCDAGAYEVVPGFLFANGFEGGTYWAWSAATG